MEQIKLQVKPGSQKGPLVQLNEDGSLTVYVRERAVDGAANEAVIKILAKHFGVAKSTIEITKGQTTKHKTIEIKR